MIAASQYDRDGMLRSLSAPALARKRQHATQSLLRAVETKNVDALRQLSLQADAELGGCRAITRLGANPREVLASCEHFDPDERRKVNKQLGQLPQLLDVAQAARESAGAQGIRRNKGAVSTSKIPSKNTVGSRSERYEDSESQSPSRVNVSQGVGSSQSPSAKTQRGGGLGATTARKAREIAATNSVTHIAKTMGEFDMACHATYKNPALLKAPAECVACALPALKSALRSRDLAMRATTKNPGLMFVEGSKFKKVVPVLTSILGSSSEAAYAVSTRPELLEVERPQQLKDTVQVVAQCSCAMNDAVWLVIQTIVPPSVRLTARPFSHDAIVGEYVRLKGVRTDGKPVYCKKACTMEKQFGPKAKDLYLVYSQGEDGEEAGWQILPQFDRASGRRSPRTRRSPTTSQTLLPSQSQSEKVMTFAPSEANSPDQVPLGGWHFHSDGSDAWTVDNYVKVADAGRRRGPPLFLAEPSLVRSSFDQLTEALGVFWREATPEGAPIPGSRLIGCARRGDKVQSGGEGVIGLSLGEFTLVNGYTFIRVPRESTQPLALLAWEPITVCLLYLQPEPKKEEEIEPEEPVAKAPPPKKGKPEPVEPEEPVDPGPLHRRILSEDGWWLMGEKTMNLPLIVNAPEVGDVIVRSYPRGQCVIPLPQGPQGAPLVFVKAAVAGSSGRGNRPWEVTKAVALVPVFQTSMIPGGSGTEPLVGDVPAEQVTSPALMKSAGDLGYSGYLFFRAPSEDRSFAESATQLRIDTEDRIRVVVAWFRRLRTVEEKQAEAAAAEEAAAASAGDAASSSEAEATSAAVPPPSLPRWATSSGSGWRNYEPRLGVTLVDESGEEVKSIGFRAQDVPANCQLVIKGSGPELTCLVFYIMLDAPRPDVLRGLLHKEPGLLSSSDSVAFLMRRLRVELGNDEARTVLVDKTAEWSFLCQATSEEEIESWVYDRKLDFFGREIRSVFGTMGSVRSATNGSNEDDKERWGIDMARKLISKRPELAKVTAPLWRERFGALKSCLGGKTPLFDVLTSRPDLLERDASLFKHALEALGQVFSVTRARGFATAFPELLTRGEQIKALFAKLEERFAPIYQERLRERTEGAWPLWRQMVEESDGNVSQWLGRITAEERSLTCKDRVQGFGR
eukprot:TRINITY_DN44564_c0_g1_i1.p1 TRINITY_DN44564_c0_g1~~TRINITY_DN44564_c0_g1_i1.p1  ORF type:complete len:1149 (-),score=210.94 TRINITY_DN44564_c0_g1_i1:166-3573(-)